MTFALFDRIQETTATVGTGSLTLAGAVAGFSPFSFRYANGDTLYYCLVETSTGAWEVGLGTWNAGVLARTTILASSTGAAVINLAAGTKQVFVTYPASASVIKSYVDRVSTDDASTARTFAATDQTKYLRLTAATAIALTVAPQSSVATAEACYAGIQAGAGQITFVQGAGVTINTPETLKTRKPFSSWSLRQKGNSDVWDLAGDIELAP